MKNIYKKGLIVIAAMFLGVALASCHASASFTTQSSSSSVK